MKILTFCLLVVLFSISLASGNTLQTSARGHPQTSKVVTDQSAAISGHGKIVMVRHVAWIPPVLILANHEPFRLHTKFIPPALPDKSPPVFRELPLIGWNNVNCYGGTVAKYARG